MVDRPGETDLTAANVPAAKSSESPGRNGVTTRPVSAKTIPHTSSTADQVTLLTAGLCLFGAIIRRTAAMTIEQTPTSIWISGYRAWNSAIAGMMTRLASDAAASGPPKAASAP